MAVAADRLSVGAALEKGRDHLLSLQHPQGWWKGELQTNVTMDAEDLLLRQFLGVRRPDETAEAAAWIRSQQAEDGSWATFHGGPGDLSTTIEAYVALRLAGDPPGAAHMRSAAEFARDAGGIERSRVFTRIWLALFGQWPWEALPAMPPEVLMLPAWMPLNVYDFACWARQTVVALTVVAAHRPRRSLPFGTDELLSGLPPLPGHPPTTTAGRLEALDRLLHLYERSPLKPTRRAALARAEAWILRRQEADGSWGGIQPPWVYSLMALHLQGYPLDHPAMSKGMAGLDGFIVRDERGRRLEACQSPVWDTALAVIALSDAGLPAGHPALESAARWLLGEEIRVRGDWSVRRPELEPGGWAFEFHNDNYPDVDDTAEVVMALRRAVGPGGDAGLAAAVEAAVARGIDWVLGMQCRDGGWAAFDVDNTRALCTKLPFCDFGEVIDPPSADVTAHVVEMLAAEPASDPTALRRGVDWLLRSQESEGSWFGRWGANHVYGTGAVVPALAAAGAGAGTGMAAAAAGTGMAAAAAGTGMAVKRGLRWLKRCQNGDGGWGEDMRSYRDPSWVGRGESTASQTAWALLALLAAGDRGAEAEAGVAWLVDHQRPDGGWDEPQFTGTGFPGDFYINYHLYRLVFPLTALGRWVNGEGAAR
ncbi:MAG TPA: squalene--hopene cyclase [Acidimicrobiales bacterium]|nr:squalene--hopene cyclase [Acidimicrobiales bacterium]